jgi:hypothetical protein
VFRTGLSKVGIPAAPIGMSEKILTIAAALKNQGYATLDSPARLCRLGCGAMGIAQKFAATFKDFPPIQKPNTFTIDDALKMMQSAGGHS